VRYNDDDQTKKLYEKFKIIERVKNGESKASLFRECGIEEGTIRGWIKEENKLRSFVDSIEEGRA
jgi:hypothetical protein